MSTHRILLAAIVFSSGLGAFAHDAKLITSSDRVLSVQCRATETRKTQASESQQISEIATIEAALLKTSVSFAHNVLGKYRVAGTLKIARKDGSEQTSNLEGEVGIDIQNRVLRLKGEALEFGMYKALSSPADFPAEFGYIAEEVTIPGHPGSFIKLWSDKTEDKKIQVEYKLSCNLGGDILDTSVVTGAKDEVNLNKMGQWETWNRIFLGDSNVSDRSSWTGIGRDISGPAQGWSYKEFESTCKDALRAEAPGYNFLSISSDISIINDREVIARCYGKKRTK